VTDKLIDAARAVQRRAYAPYSNFHVGAALESEDGTIYTGCNVENASYGLTICAERAAICAAIAAGARKFRRVVVVSDVDPPAAPCGACRQVLAEFARDLRIDAIGPAGTVSWTIAQLLPAAFSKEQLT
jgi:cytidine deaminase